MKFDLHMHSCYSKDGEFTPKELIEIAQSKNLELVALCDHDQMQGIDSMIKEGQKAGIKVVPAIEFSTVFEGLEVHLLGYNFDYKQPYFETIGEHVNQLMDDALHERVVKLEKKYGVSIDEKRCIEEAGDGNPYFTIITSMLNDPANQHIEAFRPYQKGGSRCEPAVPNFYWDNARLGSDLFVKVDFPTMEDTIKKIHEAGGIAILAHPWIQFYEKEELLEKAVQAGLDGLEVFSNYHEPIHNEYYEAYARKKGLLMTCGSDFHGKTKKTIAMGEYGADEKHSECVASAFIEKVI